MNLRRMLNVAASRSGRAAASRPSPNASRFAATATRVAAGLDGRIPPVPGNSFSVPSGKTFVYTGFARAGQQNLLHLTSGDALAVQSLPAPATPLAIARGHGVAFRRTVRN